jgi:hypothetical protein
MVETSISGLVASAIKRSPPSAFRRRAPRPRGPQRLRPRQKGGRNPLVAISSRSVTADLQPLNPLKNAPLLFSTTMRLINFPDETLPTCSSSNIRVVFNARSTRSGLRWPPDLQGNARLRIFYPIYRRKKNGSKAAWRTMLAAAPVRSTHLWTHDGPANVPCPIWRRGCVLICKPKRESNSTSRCSSRGDTETARSEMVFL